MSKGNILVFLVLLIVALLFLFRKIQAPFKPAAAGKIADASISTPQILILVVCGIFSFIFVVILARVFIKVGKKMR